jgi:adenylyl-sulfate kinase
MGKAHEAMKGEVMKGFTLWFTGLSGSGKSTLANELEGMLLERGCKVEILDGDVVRTNLSKGLGFSKEDRDINIRRIGWVCHVLTRNDVVAIAAAISPYEAIREENRKMIGRFVCVYCECSIDDLKARDPKGLYEKALRGEIKNFTGIDDPYEPPVKPEVVCHTGKETMEESLTKIIKTLELLGYIPPVAGEKYNAEQEAKIKQRLKDLGYL